MCVFEDLPRKLRQRERTETEQEEKECISAAASPAYWREILVKPSRPRVFVVKNFWMVFFAPYFCRVMQILVHTHHHARLLR